MMAPRENRLRPFWKPAFVRAALLSGRLSDRSHAFPTSPNRVWCAAASAYAHSTRAL